MKETRLNALKDFNCLGGSCPDNCCIHNWHIDVDPATLEKWSRVEDLPSRNTLLSSVVSQEEKGKRTIRIVQHNHQCPHLTPDKFCGVQRRFGSDLLPDVCRDYPRSRFVSPIRTLISAQLSCPEMARLVLFPPAPEEPFRETTSAGLVPVAADAIVPQYLDAITAHVLRQTKFPLHARIVFIAQLLSDMALLSQQNKLDEATLRNVARGVSAKLYETNLAIKQGRIRPDPKVAGAFWRGVYHVSADLFASFAAELPETVLRDALRQENGDERYVRIYDALRETRSAANASLAPHADAFERHVVVSLMNHGFPWNPTAGNYVATLINALFPLATTRLLLWLIASDGRAITQADVVRVVYRAERALTHSRKIYEFLGEKQDALRLDQYFQCFVDLA